MSFVFAINWLALLFSFFVLGCVIGAMFSPPVRRALEALAAIIRRDLLLARIVYNPVLKPGKFPFASEAVLNPAAAAAGGRVHLLYRAISSDGVSRLGYAGSKNGLVFDDLAPYPAYAAQEVGSVPRYGRRYAPVLYPSGGSWGGCEDPRMVVIEGQVYLTFNMFENWQLRVAYITISEEDFLAKRFEKWEGPYILSHGTRDKNWVLFPEKMGGKFAVLHSVIGDTSDQVRIEYIEDLRMLRQRVFESPDPQQAGDRTVAWHSHIRSAGPPPVKTAKGWLVFYHAHEAHDAHRYKLGAMLLDLDDPTKVLARAIHPVLEPDAWYENDGKPGIVYATGCVVRGDMLYLYYGGADKVVCVAVTHLSTFIDAILEGREIALSVEP